ncbi:MAG: LlaJI family restriction endonuclease [bacterium]
MVSSINNFYKHKVTNKTNDSFTGIKIIENEIHFYYPESFDLETKEDILKFLNTFSINKELSKEETNINNDQSGDEYSLSSYLFLIDDYFKNGIIVNREKVYKTNQNGKVNWKRTLEQNPIISNNNVIYTNMVVESKNIVDNLLVDIYKHCLKRSIDVIGFLFNIKSNFLVNKPFNNLIKQKYLTTLLDELSKTFDDVKRNKLNHLISIVKGLSSYSTSRDIVYGVDNYHYIYEYMINKIFCNIKEIKDFYPKATWQIIGLSEFESSKLRPDTILIKDNVGYILDAKYYRFGTTGDTSHLPDTSSISKQIIYAEYLEQLNKIKNLNIKKIYNAFLLPYNKNDNIFNYNDELKYIGNSKSLWKDNEETYHLIHTILIDLKHIIYSYNNYNHNIDIKELIDSIKKNSR